MSNFACEKCGAICYDTPIGYVTGCEHYPADKRAESALKEFQGIMAKLGTLEKRVELYATMTTYTPNSYTGETEVDEQEDLIATFSNKKLAKLFVDSCRLKKPIQNTWTNNEPFKRRSLLGGYGSVEIRTSETPPNVPHNPK